MPHNLRGNVKLGVSHFVPVNVFHINNIAECKREQQENGKVPTTKSPDVGTSIKVLS